MAQTIRRKAAGVRRQARGKARKGQVRKARAAGTSVFGRMMQALPLTEQQWHRVFMAAIIVAVLGIALVVANVTGASALAAQRFDEAAANAGFKVRHVEVHGTHYLNQMRIYEKAIGRENLAMPLVNLDQLRKELLAISWVKDARVSRQLPDSLVIDIVERKPYAVLQTSGGLELIDRTGVELQPVSRARAKGMLLIAGTGAQSQVEALHTLLNAAPALRPQVAQADWIGNRRWDLVFTTGQRLSLPEGADRASAALVSFAHADGIHRLIGGDVSVFDLRNPPRMYMRVPGSDPGNTANDSDPAKEVKYAPETDTPISNAVITAGDSDGANAGVAPDPSGTPSSGAK